LVDFRQRTKRGWLERMARKKVRPYGFNREFSDRLNVLLNRFGATLFDPIQLADLASFALSVGWSIPDELEALARPPKSELPAPKVPLTVVATPAPVVPQEPVEVTTPAPIGQVFSDGSAKKWTPEKLDELRSWRDAHTMPETAAKFGISVQRIRQLLPRKSPKASPFSGVIHRTK
jgi:hypothetical protein